MRIALLMPSYWPEVTRGSERIVHDTATMLARHGHEVTLITGHAGPTTESVEDGFRVIRSRRLPRLERFRYYEHHLENVPNVIRRVLRGRFDLAHAFFLTDAWAAVKARRLGGPPVIFSFHGLPVRSWLVERRYRIEMIAATIAGAAATTVLSEAAGRALRRFFPVEPLVLPAGVFASEYALDVERDPRPTLLCTASLGDPRKRGELLLDAFAALRRRRPEVRLLLARPRDHVLSPRLLELPEGASWLVRDPMDHLAPDYASAWASVLPAINEAQGMVLLESLAAGTPAVAARSGACPEILDRASIGCLFEPDDAGALVDALETGVELGGAPGTAAACRSRALDYDWERMITGYEELYETVAAGAPLPSRR